MEATGVKFEGNEALGIFSLAMLFYKIFTGQLLMPPEEMATKGPMWIEFESNPKKFVSGQRIPDVDGGPARGLQENVANMIAGMGNPVAGKRTNLEKVSSELEAIETIFIVPETPRLSDKLQERQRQAAEEEAARNKGAQAEGAHDAVEPKPDGESSHGRSR